MLRRLALAAAWLALVAQPVAAQTGYTPDSRSRGGDDVTRTGTPPVAGQSVVWTGPRSIGVGGSAPNLIGIQTFSTAGTFTYTPDAGTSAILVQVQGGGGGGAGCANPGGASNACTGAGGAGGAWGQKRYTTGFSGATVVVGAAANGGTAGNNAGTTGNLSSFAPSGGTTCSAAGGQPGAASTPGGVAQMSQVPAAAGTATGCDLNVAGGAPVFGLATSTIFWNQSGAGGSATWGGGAKPAFLANGGPASIAGINCPGGYGGGGSGAAANGNGATAQAGGNGCQGAVVIYEYGPNAVGGQAGLPVIGEVVTSGSQASVTFSNIPQTYRDLKIVVSGQGSAASTQADVYGQLNGDTGSNYDSQTLDVSNTSSTAVNFFAAQAQMLLGTVTGSTAPANVNGSLEATLFNYAGAAFQKTLQADSNSKKSNASGNLFGRAVWSWWRSTAAVTSIKVYPASGNFVDGTVVTLYGVGGSPTATLPLTTPQGRLTLVSGTPVMTSDQTAKGTIFYDNYVGNLLPVGGIMYQVGELSDVLNATAHTSGNLYDVFAYNSSGTIALCAGPAWTNSTTRSAGIALTNGIWANSASLTCTISGGSSTTTIAAGQATYLGTFDATANGQTGQAMTPAAASGGAGPTLGLSNAYNRVPVCAVSRDSKGSWTYASTTYEGADNSTANRVTFVDGLALAAITADWAITISNSGGAGYTGMSLDSTSATPQNVSQTNAGAVVEVTVPDAWPPQTGLHFVQAQEASSGTTTYFGGNTTPTRQLNELKVCLAN